MHIIGFQAKQDEGTLFVCFTNVWMLLNYFCVINTGWPVQLMGDATFNFCESDIGLAGFGVMQAGGRLAPLIYSLVPTESAEAYALMWNSFSKTAISLVRKFSCCEKAVCSTCSSINRVLQHPRTASKLSDEKFTRQKRLAVDFATSDNSQAWKSFSIHQIGLIPQKCIAHLIDNQCLNISCS